MTREVRHIGVRLEGEGDDQVRHVSFEPGELGEPGANLRQILDRTSARVRTACAGIGACGLCRVRIDQGAAGGPTAAEVLHLGEVAVAARTRLACQVIPGGDMDVTVLQRARASPWRAPSSASYRAAYPRSSDRATKDVPLGVAVDLGTTHITVATCDVSSGRHLDSRWGPNPQDRLGADVVGRLDAARSQVDGQRLRRLAVEAIGSALFDLSQDSGIALSGVGHVRVVGNSAMLILLSGRSPEAVLDPGRWLGPVDCRLDDVADMAKEWSLSPHAAIDLVQPLGGFVGSDLMAGVVHCRLLESDEPGLLIDFGTNSEIALWDGERLWATAAAGGPAFEAAGIACGLGAEPGAIHHLSRSPDGTWRGDTLESLPPRGVCGSGLVDMLALLLASGEIDERGRVPRAPLSLAVDGAEFAVSKADVDALQRAKAAVAAGTEVLCRRAGVRFDELGTVHLAGSFGEHLDVENAMRIGLLPPIPASRVRLAGNTALHGALDLLLSLEAEAALERARRGSTLVNLSMEDEFEELFLDHLYIRPMVAQGQVG